MESQTTISYKTSDFEGPLDLLLSLIAKNKINIYDISIVELVDQYTEQIEIMTNADMDIASEFLEMASRLVYIKSVMLLPKYEDEAEILKQELTGQLIEYMECKQMAAKFAQMVSFDRFVREPSPVEYDLTYNRIHRSTDIAYALESAIGRGKNKLPPPETAFSGIVSHKIISVSSRIVFVIRKLWKINRAKYHELFANSNGHSELVATFLAILELVKGKRITINGDGDNADVTLVRDKNHK